MRSRNFKPLPTVYYSHLKLQPEDGLMKAETCNCYVLLINYILCNKVALDCKFIYNWYIQENQFLELSEGFTDNFQQQIRNS
jgi:hypothetical protein